MTILSRTALYAVSFAVISLVPIGAQETPPSPVITDSEAYSVYAAVLKPIVADDERQKVIAIQLETLDTEECHANRPVPSGWNDVVANYAAENAQTRFLLPGLPLGKPYSLIPAADVRKMLTDAGVFAPNAPRTNCPGCAVFSGFPGRGLLAFSAVGFNADKTRAIVTVQLNCIVTDKGRAFCHEGHRQPLEKKNGEWVFSSVAWGCHWIV